MKFSFVLIIVVSIIITFLTIIIYIIPNNKQQQGLKAPKRRVNASKGHRFRQSWRLASSAELIGDLNNVGQV